MLCIHIKGRHQDHAPPRARRERCAQARAAGCGRRMFGKEIIKAAVFGLHITEPHQDHVPPYDVGGVRERGRRREAERLRAAPEHGGLVVFQRIQVAERASEVLVAEGGG
jgi:hypothetical protein